VSDPPPALTHALAPAEATPMPRRLRVLVADDCRDAADTLAAVLRLAGVETAVCYDGPAALAAAGWFRPDACLLDLAMPGLDGDQVAVRLNQRAGADRVLLVAVTAWADDAARARTAGAGFDLHLVKPVDPRDLLAALADADWWLAARAAGGARTEG
jgi:two-component system OmpR family response regulator